MPLSHRYDKIILLFVCLFFSFAQAQAANLPPGLNPIGAKTTCANCTLEFTVSAPDPDGDTVTYAVYLAGDTNHDGVLSPIDALRIINTMNRYGSGIKPGSPGWNPEMDLNFDGYISPIDALIIINMLNSGINYPPSGISLESNSGRFLWRPNPSQQGNHQLTFVATDASLTDAEAVVVTVTAPSTQDTTAPTGSIKINNDEPYTSSTTVTLTLSAQDNPGGSGLAKMQFSNDNSNWTALENYSTTKSWTLTSADGTKTAYVKFTDNAGNLSAAYSDTIILDTTAPQVAITAPADGEVIN